MLIAVRFVGSIKQYTYSAPEGTKVGIYYFEDKLVVVAGTVEKQPDFEVKEFKGVYVQDELMRIHIGSVKKALEKEDYLVMEEQVKLLNMIRTGLIDKYVNIVPADIVREYVEWLL